MRIARGGVKRVNLMTYVSDPAKVAADVEPILAAYPSIAFTISQSVEAPPVLPAWDSYWRGRICDVLRGHASAGCLVAAP